MPGFTDLKNAFDSLNLRNKAVIVHSSLKKFGLIQGGPRAVVQALSASFKGVMVPTFTYKTMVTPEVGPPNNGITYGSHKDNNKMAERFYLQMPADKMMGILPDTLLSDRDAARTPHPILSFAGIRADEYLSSQTLFNPLAPIGALMEDDGWVVLLNVDHTVNTSIHYGEKLAGRRQFLRWAMLSDRIIECPGYPGDSSGFNEIEDHLKSYTLHVDMYDGAFIQAVPLKRLIHTTMELIKKNPLALLCQRSDCERCNAVRNTQGDPRVTGR